MSVSHDSARTTSVEPVSRSRGRLTLGVVVVLVLVVAAAVLLSRRSVEGTPAAQVSVTPSALPAMPVTTSTLHQNLSIDLPGWTAYAHRDGWARDAIKYAQAQDCTGLCPNGSDRTFILLTPEYFYAPSDHTHIVTKPTYAQYLAAWDSLQSAGMGKVRDRTTTTVDGRPAVVMTVDFTNAAAGLAACETGISAPDDCWNTFAGRTARVALLDAPLGPVQLYAAANTDNPAKAGLTAEMDAALATVRFDRA